MFRTLRAMPTIWSGSPKRSPTAPRCSSGALDDDAADHEMLWTAVAEFSPVVASNGRQYGTPVSSPTFLAVFIVRQLVSSCASWEINWEVRPGHVWRCVLRVPIHPGSFSYARAHRRAARRAFVVLRVVIIFASGAAERFPHDLHHLGCWRLSMLLGWMVTFFANVAIGALSMFIESSIKVMDVWLAAFFVFFRLPVPARSLSRLAEGSPTGCRFATSSGCRSSCSPARIPWPRRSRCSRASGLAATMCRALLHLVDRGRAALSKHSEGEVLRSRCGVGDFGSAIAAEPAPKPSNGAFVGDEWRYHRAGLLGW